MLEGNTGKEELMFGNSLGAKMKTILLVEDEIALRFMLRYFLEQEGYVVLTTKSGNEALEKLEHIAVDLMITGIVMPGMNGLVLLQNLRANPSYNSLPVLILTGSTEEVCQEALGLGADAVLVKPASVQSIFQAINTLLVST